MECCGRTLCEHIATVLAITACEGIAGLRCETGIGGTEADSGPAAWWCTERRRGAVCQHVPTVLVGATGIGVGRHSLSLSRSFSEAEVRLSAGSLPHCLHHVS